MYENYEITSCSLEPFTITSNEDKDKLEIPQIDGISIHEVLKMHSWYAFLTIAASDKEDEEGDHTAYESMSKYSELVEYKTGIHRTYVILIAWWLAYDFNNTYKKDVWIYCNYEKACAVATIDEDGDSHWTIVSFEDGKYKCLFNNKDGNAYINSEDITGFIQLDEMLTRCLVKLTLEDGKWNPF